MKLFYFNKIVYHNLPSSIYFGIREVLLIK
jgi:hypothetical protein